MFQGASTAHGAALRVLSHAASHPRKTGEVSTMTRIATTPDGEPTGFRRASGTQHRRLALCAWSAAAVAFGASPDAIAADFFVDGATGCSDAGPGSQAQPWCTIQKAADSIAAGDTAHVLAGSYDEALTVSVSGTSGNVVTLRSEVRRTATILGGIVVSGSYVRIEGFNVEKSVWEYSSAVEAEGEYDEILDNAITNIPQGPAIGAGRARSLRTTRSRCRNTASSLAGPAQPSRPTRSSGSSNGTRRGMLTTCDSSGRTTSFAATTSME